MKQLTIFTRNYCHLLEKFAHEKCTYKTCLRGGMFSVSIRFIITDSPVIEALLTLLTDIALQENPIFKHSPKLQDMAGDLRNTQVFSNLKRSLLRFIKHNNSLHLEGYVAFRMAEYREKLDIMSYSLIKKMKLIRQD